jgi:hypothetical protein
MPPSTPSGGSVVIVLVDLVAGGVGAVVGVERLLDGAVHHQPTARYYAKLIAAGKTKREARRCVKRALARYFYRRLCSTPKQALTT